MIERNDGQTSPMEYNYPSRVRVKKRSRDRETEVVFVTKRELFIRTLYSRAPVVSMTHISVGLEAILFVFVGVCKV